MNKRFAVLAATAVVAFGMVMTGCGSNNASSSSTNNSQSAGNNTSSSQQQQAATGDEQVVHVTAKNFAWQLDKTEVKKGKPVKLLVTASEGMHALTIPGTNVSNVHAMNGDTETVTFTPDKAGDLELVCSQMCGLGHGDMHTTLKVVD